MKVFGLSVLVVLSIVGLGAPLADASELPYKSITCGDHWLKIEINLDSDSNRAQVEFRGDSQPKNTLVLGTYEFSSQDSVRIVSVDEAGLTIEIDGNDAIHNIFWGTIIDKKSGLVTQLGLCSVE